MIICQSGDLCLIQGLGRSCNGRCSRVHLAWRSLLGSNPAFAFNNTDHITKVIATSRTLEILTSHLVDGVVYPKFASGELMKVRLENGYLPVESRPVVV